jgi:hypothetical protein
MHTPPRGAARAILLFVVTNNPLQEIGRVNFESLAQADEDGDSRLAFASLKIVDVFTREASFRRKLLLGQTSGTSGVA